MKKPIPGEVSQIEDVSLIELFRSSDCRGSFTKTFTCDSFGTVNNLSFEIKETYYTVSCKNVIRGLHFQNPPYDHEKLVHCVSGKILDVVMDIRLNSPTYGKFVTFELSGETPSAVIIPRGCAHGFLSMQDNTMVIYHTSSKYTQSHDSGILWCSVGVPWNIEFPIISERDKSFLPFSEFKSQFVYRSYK